MEWWEDLCVKVGRGRVEAQTLDSLSSDLITRKKVIKAHPSGVVWQTLVCSPQTRIILQDCKKLEWLSRSKNSVFFLLFWLGSFLYRKLRIWSSSVTFWDFSCWCSVFRSVLADLQVLQCLPTHLLAREKLLGCFGLVFFMWHFLFISACWFWFCGLGFFSVLFLCFVYFLLWFFGAWFGLQSDPWKPCLNVKLSHSGFEW